MQVPLRPCAFAVNAMDSQFGKDLTVGSIPKHLLAFSIPMLLGNLLQTGYSIINMIWVGNILGENAVGATAVSFPIMFILIGLAAGSHHGDLGPGSPVLRRQGL